MKGKILTIGYIDENRMPKGWEFDCMDIVPVLEIKDGLRLYAGYTIQELENISLKMIILKCLNCGKEWEFEEDSNEALGVFNVFCKNTDCEDRYAAKL